MKDYYLDLSKICFGVGFYGCIVKLEDPVITVIIAILSLAMAVIFAKIGYQSKEEN